MSEDTQEKFIFIAPQAAYAASAALCVTDRTVVQRRPPLKPCAHELWPAATQPHVYSP